MKEEIPQFVFVPSSVVSVNYVFALHKDILNILREEEDYFLENILHDDFIWSAHLQSDQGITLEIHNLMFFPMNEVVNWINKSIHETIKEKFDMDEYIKLEKKDHKKYLERIKNKTKKTPKSTSKRR
jgi:hypothetical protein